MSPATGESGNPAASRTTTVTDSLLVATLSRYGTTAATTNKTSLFNSVTGSVLGAASYQLASTTGSYSDTYTGSSANDWSMVISEFRPATTEGGGEEGSTTVHYVHTDHLTGSNVVTDSSDALEETMDYFPYGSIRVDTKAGSFDEQKKFAGSDFDADTNLNYMQARYYKSDIGRFVSEDPMFLNIGSSGFMEMAMMIVDPQRLNSYSYANNNPVKNIDPSGLGAKSFFEEQKNKIIESLAKSLMQTFESLRQGQIQASQRLSENENAQVLLNLCALFCGLEGGLEESTAVKVGEQVTTKTDDVVRVASKSYNVYKTTSKYSSLSDAYSDLISKPGTHGFAHRSEFDWIKTQEEFDAHVKNTIANPTHMKYGKNDRMAFYDEQSNTVVIVNRRLPDRSTVFRPKAGGNWLNTNFE